MGRLFSRLRAARGQLAESRWAAIAAWVVTLPLAAWALTRSFGLERGFPAVALIAFTPYVAALGPVAVVWALLLGRRGAALVAAVAAVALLAAVVPRTIASDTPSGNGPTLRTMSINLLAGEADIGEVASLVEREDVRLLSVQELTPKAAREIEASSIGERLPFSRLEPDFGSRGIGLYAAYPLTGGGEAGLGFDQPGLQARLRIPGTEPLLPVAIHPAPPSSPAGVRSLVDYLDGIPPADADRPARVLLGDFNATLDNGVLRDLLGRGYVDAADQLGVGLEPTWPRGPWPPPVTIDHVIYDDRLAALRYDVVPVSRTDHRAVLAELLLPPPR